MKQINLKIHNRRSVRLKDYDYAGDGMYYVTVCTHRKDCVFGEIINGKMHRSSIGKVVSEYWKQIPNHHTDVTLDEFVVMPNHVHGIIAIVGTTHSVSPPTDVPVGATHSVPLGMPTLLHPIGYASPNSAKPGPKPRSLGAIIGSFKSAVTKSVNEFHNSPGATFWQRNYYEHIIRNEHEQNLVRQYIISNPLQWELDRENPASNAKTDRDEISEILKGNGGIEKGEACLAPTRRQL